MKKLILYLLILILFSCQKDSNMNFDVCEGLAKQILTDELFQSMTNESNEFITLIKAKIIEQPLSSTEIIKSSFTFDELNKFLEIPENYLNNSYKSIENKSRKIIEKYDLHKMTETKVKDILFHLSLMKNSQYELLRLKNATCEEIFAQRISEIHSSYDNGVILCLITGIWGGLSAIITCESFLIYNTIYNIAVAIDNFNACAMSTIN